LVHERILDFFLRSDLVFSPLALFLAEDGGLVSGERNSLVEHARNLPVELAYRRTSAQSLGFVEYTGLDVLHPEQADIVGLRSIRRIT
jgi:hypothetical protein